MSKPILYDHLGKEVSTKQYPQTGDPGFFSGWSGRQTSRLATRTIERHPYKYHSWVFAVAHRIVVNLSSLPHVLFRWKEEDSDPIRDHEILRLFRRPNYLISGTELWELIVLNLLLPTTRTPGGQVFLVPESGKDVEVPKLGRGEIPKEIWPFSDEVMKPRRDPKTKLLNGWRMEIAGQRLYEFELDEVVRIRLVNPYNIEQGLSPYSAAQMAVYQDTSSDEYNTRFYENMGVLSGVLTTDQEIDQAQARQAKQEFEEEYGGAGNAGKVAVFGAGLKYEQHLKSHLDMQFQEQRKDNRARIQAVYGVPDEEIAIFDKGMNRATAQQADRNFWQKTLLPLDKKIWDGLNIQWIENIERGELRGKSDLSNVEALKAMYTEQVKDAERLMKMNVPPAEALRIAGVPIDVKAYPWLEETYVNINLVPITSLSGEGGTEPEPKPGPKKPPTAPPKKMFDGLEDKALGLLGATERAGAEARAKASEKWIKGVLNPGERTLRAKMQRHLSGLKREMLDKVDAWLGRQEARTIRQVSIDPKAFVFSKAQAAEQLEGIIRDNISQQAKREEAHLKQEYGDAIKWNASDETIAQFVRERQTYIKQINTHTFNAARAKIGQIVQQGIENNWTPQELAKALKAGIKAIPTGGSAARIARTETGSISNRARFDAFQQSEIKRHQWSTSRDELVRNTHMIDGEEQDVGKMFSNGLHFPQEPGAPASEVINCRCTVLPLV